MRCCINNCTVNNFFMLDEIKACVKKDSKTGFLTYCKTGFFHGSYRPKGRNREVFGETGQNANP